MTVTYHTGDILESGASIIAHQVNCKGVMGAGLAKQIRDRWPHVYTVYKDSTDLRGSSMLGKCLLVFCGTQAVANLFGQDGYGRDKQYTNYTALRSALRQLARIGTSSIAFPYGMGAGLGGGDWDTVLRIIKEEFSDYSGEIQIWRRVIDGA